ncbi:MAG: hypothetical protein V2A79_01050, partial [Planctomycetota bacterium]
MADDLTILTGDEVATDEIAGVHYQRVKLVDGTPDSTTPIAAGAGVKANGMRVAFATDDSLPAGTALIGEVGIDQTTPGTT